MSETYRDPRTEALARRLDAAPWLARASFEYAAADPDTGRLWLVDASGHMQGGSWLLEMRPLSRERAAALREDPTLLERAQRLYHIDWPIDVLVGGRRSADEVDALLRRLDAPDPPPDDHRGSSHTLVDPVTGWPWVVNRCGVKGHEWLRLGREVHDGVIVGEDSRHEAFADYIDRLEASPSPDARADDTVRTAVDPDTGWTWTLSDETGPYGEPARRLRSIPASAPSHAGRGEGK